jgi:hypothetical protein
MPQHKRGKRKPKGSQLCFRPSAALVDPAPSDTAEMDSEREGDTPRPSIHVQPPYWPFPIVDVLDEEGGLAEAGAGEGRRVALAEELRRLGIHPEASHRPGPAAMVTGATWYQACKGCGVSAVSWRAAVELWRCRAGEPEEDGSGYEKRSALLGVCLVCGLDLVWAEWMRLVGPGTAPLEGAWGEVD